MSSSSRVAAILVALFGSIPLGLIIAFVLMWLFRSINGGVTPTPIQSLQSLFAGFAFGLAAFVFVYSSVLREP